MTRLRLEVAPDAIPQALEAEREALAMRLRSGVERAGRQALLLPLRERTRRAFPKARKLPTTWRGKTYPESRRHTLTPAYVVSSAAPRIISAFVRDTVIAPKGGKRFLWIPTENVPRGAGGKPRSPAEIKRAFGDFAYKPSGEGRFVATVKAEAKAAPAPSRRRRGSPVKRASKAARKAGRAHDAVMFVLVRQVRLRQRLDLPSILAEAAPRFAAIVAGELRRA